MNYYYFCLPDNFNQGRSRLRESAPNQYLKYIASGKAKGKAWRAKNSHSQAATSITVIFWRRFRKQGRGEHRDKFLFFVGKQECFHGAAIAYGPSWNIIFEYFITEISRKTLCHDYYCVA